MTDRLEPKPVQHNKAAEIAAQLSREGKPPLATGKAYVTSETAKQLRAVGWEEGDPIPPDLGQRLAEIQQEVLKERQDSKLEDSELAAGWTPPKAKFVKIEELPADKQEEIQQYLQEYKQVQEQAKQQQQYEQQLDARIPENITGPQRDMMRQQIAAGEAAQAQRNMAEGCVIDDREQPPAKPLGDVPTGKQFAGNLGNPSLADKIEQAAQAHTQQAVPEREEEPVVEDTHIHATNCPRCLWPLSQAFEVEPSDEDKQSFMAAILAMTRFSKRYSLMGDNVVVFMQSMTTQDAELVSTQLNWMVRKGMIIGDAEYWTYLMEFRLMLMVTKIEIGGNVAYTLPEQSKWLGLSGLTSQEVQPTLLPHLRKYFYTHAAPSEPMRRILTQTHRGFQQLVEALEAMTQHPDFWTGIKLPV